MEIGRWELTSPRDSPPPSNRGRPLFFCCSSGSALPSFSPPTSASSLDLFIPALGDDADPVLRIDVAEGDFVFAMVTGIAASTWAGKAEMAFTDGPSRCRGPAAAAGCGGVDDAACCRAGLEGLRSCFRKTRMSLEVKDWL